MKIEINRDIAELIPETPEEWAQLEAFWLKLIPSGGRTKGVLPLGAYPTGPEKPAQFRMEGLSLAEKHDLPVLRAPEATEAWCPVCGQVRCLQPGEIIPHCCGRRMELRPCQTP